MKFQYFLIFIVISILSCSKSISIAANEEVGNNPDSTSYSYLALGDSYTIGTSISMANNYPSQLIDSLAARDYTISSSDILAVNGWTTSDLLSALQGPSFIDKKFDLVTLLIGVNNQYQHKPFEIFETEFEELLKIAIGYANGQAQKVIVLSIPDYSVTPIVSNSDKAQVADEINQYNARKKEIAEILDVSFIDITPISRLAENDNSLIADDNLHPSAKMYSLWVSEMIPPTVQKLK